MDPRHEWQLQQNRRYFLSRAGLSLGAAALSTLLPKSSVSAATSISTPGTLSSLHFPPKAKRVIYLFMNGGPSQLDLFDYKPHLADKFDTDLPESIRMGQRITTMTSGQSRLPVAPTKFSFQQYGPSGAWISELLPHTAGIADEIAILKTINTEAINHDPAVTYIQTGAQLPGRPSMGAWVSYGLGSMNQDLPTYVVLHSTWSAKRDAQAIYSRLWGSGFLPSEYQGVSLRSQGDPVLYLSNPPGVSPAARRKMLDGLAALNSEQYDEWADPEIQARIAQYEMAYRMQTSVPELVDMSTEPQHVLDLYGPDVHKPGTFAYNCLLARRMAERDVRYIQVFLRGWDHHGNLTGDLPLQCRDADQGAAALVTDLKQRGLLEDTLVIWGGEFGRTIYCQGGLTKTNYGRDHHGRCFAIWMAGGGVKPGIVYGETDDYGYNVVEKPVHIHDLNATVLRCLGVDHEHLTYRFQGRDFRLTDVHGQVVGEILS